jgi:hypothetical protein
MESFRARKSRQIRILRAQAQKAEQALRCAPNEWGGEGQSLHEMRMAELEGAMREGASG